MLAYIATKLENHRMHNYIRDEIAKLGIKLTYDWTTHGPVYMHGAQRIREVSESEMIGVLDADFIIVILPGGHGTHVELGMALAANKTVYILAETKEVQELAFLPVEGTCAFYHNKRCVKVFSISHLMQYIKTEINFYERDYRHY